MGEYAESMKRGKYTFGVKLASFPMYLEQHDFFIWIKSINSTKFHLERASPFVVVHLPPKDSKAGHHTAEASFGLILKIHSH